MCLISDRRLVICLQPAEIKTVAGSYKLARWLIKLMLTPQNVWKRHLTRFKGELCQRVSDLHLIVQHDSMLTD